MPHYQAPGVYIQEVPSGIRPIEGLGTSTAGFLGATQRGPLAAQRVHSFAEFERIFGGFVPDGYYLAYAVHGFFANGGRRCLVARVVGQGAQTARVQLPEARLNVAASSPGVWGREITLTVTDAAGADACFGLVVSYSAGSATETFVGLRCQPGSPDDAAAVLNNHSLLVRAWWDAPQQARRPPNGRYVLACDDDADGAALTAADFSGAGPAPPVILPIGAAAEPPSSLRAEKIGLAALEDYDDIAVVAAPEAARHELRDLDILLIEHCRQRRDRFAILSVAQGARDVRSLYPVRDTAFAATYFPWVQVLDPLSGEARILPPTGHVAGVYARNDQDSGVWKAPAGVPLLDVLDLEFPVTQEMQNVLNPRGINVLRNFTAGGRGIVVWGARTMSSDAQWKYVNVRRYFIFLEQSLRRGTEWAVFEPNDEPLWANVRRSVETFLREQWLAGALAGVTEQQAYFVRCDRSTMTQADLDAGRLVYMVGVALLRPAEFDIIRISQRTADA